MDQNENYDAIIVGICNDAAVLAEMWEVVRTLFMDYAEDVIAALTPIAEAINLSQEAVESQIMTVEDVRQHPSSAAWGGGVMAQRRPQRVQIHYNYIPRAVRNQPYQRRAY